VLSAGDTVESDGYIVGHVECDGPRGLSPEERVFLYVYCWDHHVARCDACDRHFRQDDFGADFYSIHACRCPHCRAELTDSVRAHLIACDILPEQLRRRVEAARETAQRLLKRSRQLVDRTDVLMREIEAHQAALTETRKRRPRDLDR
jgi:hypothetical protein